MPKTRTYSEGVTTKTDVLRIFTTFAKINKKTFSDLKSNSSAKIIYHSKFSTRKNQGFSVNPINVEHWIFG